MQECNETIAGGMRWFAPEPLRKLLMGPEGLRLGEWLEHRQARVIKQGPHRIVYRVDLPSLSFYVKHNLLPDTRARLRQIIRPSKARMEYDRALAVAACGVPTYTPLAVGEQARRFKSSESFLVTKALDDVTPLNVFLETIYPHLSLGRQIRLRLALAVSLGQFIARLHDSGILHHDLHCGNFLIRLEADDRPSLFLIDLQAVRFHAPLGWPASRDNLAMLNRWLFNRTTRADRLRFWFSYIHTRNGFVTGAAPQKLDADLAEKAQEVEEESLLSNQDFWRRRDRRCFEANRHFWRVRGRGIVGHAARDLDLGSLEGILENPDSPFFAAGTKMLKDSPTTTVAEVDLPLHGRARRVVYKRFRIASWTDPWINLVRPSPALRSWLNGHRVMDRSLPTARPLAVLHRRRRGLLYEGYLITETVPDAVDLSAYVQGLQATCETKRRTIVRLRIDQLARIVREMHRRCLAHRDLKAGNILVNTSLPPGESPFVLIDLVGMSRHRKVDDTRRVQNLARLNASFLTQPVISRTDRLRFLRVYLQWGFFGRHTWKTWWRRIAAQTISKAEQNARRGRPLA